MPSKALDEITYPFLEFNGCTVEVQEWKGNITKHFIMGVIIYPRWDSSWTMLVKGAPGDEIGHLMWNISFVLAN